MKIAMRVAMVMTTGILICHPVNSKTARSSPPKFIATASPQHPQQTSGKRAASYENFINLVSQDYQEIDASLRNIENAWHPGSAIMLLEVAGFARNQQTVNRIFGLMKRKTRKKFNHQDGWFRWIWSRDYDPHPQYAQFKSALYSKVDSRFAEYFVKADNAIIRLDEIRWGGVVRDGIPPLKNPEMLSVKDAGYLADSDVVFGVKLNGEARCYPKRILAWHEMFKDTIGGESVCGAY